MRKYLKILKLNRKYFILVIFGLVVTTTSAIASYSYFSKQSKDSTTYDEDLFSQIDKDSAIDLYSTAAEDLKTLNILLLGYGGAGHDGGFLTDVIQIVHLDFEKSKVSLISIPRDLWVELPNGKQAKINTAFTLGDDPNEPIDSGGQVAKQMATIVTGLPMNYFIATDFVGFKRIIGIELDGIEVQVPTTLDDPWYPIKGEELNLCGMSPEELEEVHAQYSGFELERQFECRYQQVFFEKGLNKMEGGDALAYVRSRHGSAGGDFSRSERQHALLIALRDKLLSLEALKKAPDIFSELSRHINSDVNLEVVKYLVPALTNVGSYSVSEVVLSTDNVFVNSKSPTGQFIVVPQTGDGQWQATQNFVEESIN